MDLLEWGKANNYITYGITEFVISQKWKELEYLKNNGIENDIAISTLIDD
jgi:hypothetical protein